MHVVRLPQVQSHQNVYEYKHKLFHVLVLLVLFVFQHNNDAGRTVLERRELNMRILSYVKHRMGFHKRCMIPCSHPNKELVYTCSVTMRDFRKDRSVRALWSSLLAAAGRMLRRGK